MSAARFREVCRDCGVVEPDTGPGSGNDPDNPAPGLCAPCMARHLDVVTSRLVERMAEAPRTFEGIGDWLERQFVEAGITPQHANHYAAEIRRGLAAELADDRTAPHPFVHALHCATCAVERPWRV